MGNPRRRKNATFRAQHLHTLRNVNQNGENVTAQNKGIAEKLGRFRIICTSVIETPFLKSFGNYLTNLKF